MAIDELRLNVMLLCGVSQKAGDLKNDSFLVSRRLIKGFESLIPRKIPFSSDGVRCIARLHRSRFIMKEDNRCRKANNEAEGSTLAELRGGFSSRWAPSRDSRRIVALRVQKFLSQKARG